MTKGQYKAVVGRYSNRVYTVALRLTGDAGAAEGLALSAFASAYACRDAAACLTVLCETLLQQAKQDDMDLAALYLRGYMDLDYTQIARMTGWEPSEVKARLAKARAGLCRTI